MHVLYNLSQPYIYIYRARTVITLDHYFTKCFLGFKSLHMHVSFNGLFLQEYSDCFSFAEL